MLYRRRTEVTDNVKCRNRYCKGKSCESNSLAATTPCIGKTCNSGLELDCALSSHQWRRRMRYSGLIPSPPRPLSVLSDLQANRSGRCGPLRSLSGDLHFHTPRCLFCKELDPTDTMRSPQEMRNRLESMDFLTNESEASIGEQLFLVRKAQIWSTHRCGREVYP